MCTIPAANAHSLAFGIPKGIEEVEPPSVGLIGIGRVAEEGVFVPLEIDAETAPVGRAIPLRAGPLAASGLTVAGLGGFTDAGVWGFTAAGDDWLVCRMAVPCWNNAPPAIVACGAACAIGPIVASIFASRSRDRSTAR